MNFLINRKFLKTKIKKVRSILEFGNVQLFSFSVMNHVFFLLSVEKGVWDKGSSVSNGSIIACSKIVQGNA